MVKAEVQTARHTLPEPLTNGCPAGAAHERGGSTANSPPYPNLAPEAAARAMKVTSVEGSEFAVKSRRQRGSPLSFRQSEGFTAKYPRRYRNCTPAGSPAI